MKRGGWDQRLSSTTGPRGRPVGVPEGEGEAGQEEGGQPQVPAGEGHLPWAMRREPGRDAQGSSVNHTLGRTSGQWHFLWVELAYGENTSPDGKHRTAYSKEQTLKAGQGKQEGAAITVCKSEPQDSRLPLLVSLSDPVPRNTAPIISSN